MNEPLVLNTIQHLQQFANDNFNIYFNIENKTQEELQKLWDDVYEFYFLLVCRANDTGFLEAKNIVPRGDNTHYRQSIDTTPYARNLMTNAPSEVNSWDKFKNDILIRGSYFVFITEYKHGVVQLFEGNHRLAAIHELIEEGKLPPNHKIVCMNTTTKYSGFIDMIAANLGMVERELRIRYSVQLEPRAEFKDETFFGYFRKIPSYTDCPEMNARFNNVTFKKW